MSSEKKVTLKNFAKIPYKIRMVEFGVLKLQAHKITEIFQFSSKN